MSRQYFDKHMFYAKCLGIIADARKRIPGELNESYESTHIRCRFECTE